MKRIHFALLLALAASPALAADESGLVANLGTCELGSPRDFIVVDGASSSDCDPISGGGGSDEHTCQCRLGSWAVASGGGGGGNSFTTVDAPSGSDPVADSSADTLHLTAGGGLGITGDSTTDTIAFVIATAPALAANPADCGSNTFATTIAANGDLTCASITDADVPNNITITLAATATALAANGSNCSAGTAPLGVDASGAAESCTAVAPYALVDPLKPPASAGTGGCIETFAGGAEQCSETWGNQDSASIAFNQGGASLIGDTTNELHVRAFAAATNADQTLTARINLWFDGSSANNDICGIVAIFGGTVATPTNVAYTAEGDSSTDGFFYQTDTNYDPAAGTTTNATLAWDLTTLRSMWVCHQLRYIDSTRALGMWYSVNPECTDFAQLGTDVTLTADPLFWGFYVRREGPCRVRRVQLRTDANKNVWGDP